MRLASEDIAVQIGSELVSLRPTLRAATRLAQRYDGFVAVMAGIADGNITIIADLIRETAEQPTNMPALLEEIGASGLGIRLHQLAAPLSKIVLALVSADPDDAATSKPTGKPMPFAAYHRRLFQIATGWLGWTPETAWDATPAEIIAAYEGRTDMLKAIYGGADNEPEQPAEYTPPTLDEHGHDQAFDRQGLAALKFKIGAA